jgi:hypothetical protein
VNDRGRSRSGFRPPSDPDRPGTGEVPVSPNCQSAQRVGRSSFVLRLSSSANLAAVVKPDELTPWSSRFQAVDEMPEAWVRSSLRCARHREPGRTRRRGVFARLGSRPRLVGDETGAAHRQRIRASREIFVPAFRPTLTATGRFCRYGPKRRALWERRVRRPRPRDCLVLVDGAAAIALSPTPGVCLYWIVPELLSPGRVAELRDVFARMGRAASCIQGKVLGRR